MNTLSTYEAFGFEVIHRDVVNVNPRGECVEVDFSATTPEFIARVAVEKAYEAGLQAGQEALQIKIRNLLGI